MSNLEEIFKAFEAQLEGILHETTNALAKCTIYKYKDEKVSRDTNNIITNATELKTVTELGQKKFANSHVT